MSDVLTLVEIRLRWNEVLDNLEGNDRIAWIAYFDARLANFDGTELSLDFSDSQKLAGGHEYSPARMKLQNSLLRSINEVFGVTLTIIEIA